MPAFVGRAEPLARLTAAYQALTAPPEAAVSGWAGLVLVIGEAGIGKIGVADAVRQPGQSGRRHGGVGYVLGR